MSSIQGTHYGRAVLRNALDQIEISPAGDRHRAVFAAAAGVGNVLAGGELRDEAVATVRLITMAETVGLARTDAERTVRRGIERGKATPRTAATTTRALRNEAEARFAVIDWWTAVQSHPWQGRTAGTDLRILAAFALKALKAGKRRLDESYREIAEGAGVSIGTVHKSRHRWSRFVHQVNRGNVWTGSRTTWQLTIPVAIGNIPEGNPSGKPGLFPNATHTDPSADCWYRWGNGWRVYDLLLIEPMTTTDVADALGIARSTSWRALKRLGEMNLATRDDAGRWIAHAGVAGVQEVGFIRDRRKKMHEAQRELWRRQRAHEITQAERQREGQ